MAFGDILKHIKPLPGICAADDDILAAHFTEQFPCHAGSLLEVSLQYASVRLDDQIMVLQDVTILHCIGL